MTATTSFMSQGHTGWKSPGQVSVRLELHRHSALRLHQAQKPSKAGPSRDLKESKASKESECKVAKSRKAPELRSRHLCPTRRR